MMPIWKATAAPSVPAMSFFMSRPLLTGWRTARECPIGRAGARETLKAAIRRSREGGNLCRSNRKTGPPPSRGRLLQRRLVAPDLAGGVDAKAQLRPLLIFGQVVAVMGARKAALRADAEVLERHELGRLVDPPLELVLGFELRHLGAHQAEYHLLPFGDVAQRLEAAGALGVELEEEAIDVDLGERGLGDVVIAAACEPGALEVAAAGVDANRHVVGDVADRGVDGLRVDRHVPLRIVTELAELLLHFRIAEHRDGGVVDLQVAAARLVEVGDLLAVALREILSLIH